MPRKLGLGARRFNAALVAAALAVLPACGGDPTVGDVVVRVELAPERDTLTVGEARAPFTATAFNARDDAVASAEFRWSSDQPFIASVDSLTGSVLAVTTGGAAIVARAGSVADTAQVFVVGPLVLPLDTILLYQGDTITIAVELRPGGPTSPVTFSGGDAATATVDPTSGLVTAIDFGAVNFTAHVDTFTLSGRIEVLNVQDTLFGNLYAGVSGAQHLRARFNSRGFNHPTQSGTALNLNALTFDGARQFAILLIDSLIDTRVAVIGELPESATQPGADAVCIPPGNWAFYNDRDLVRRSRSLSGGVSITTVHDVAGGRVMSGRFDVMLQLLGTPGAEGEVRARGTFVMPVVTLGSCPQGPPPPAPSHARRTPLVPPAGTPAPPRR